MDVLVVGTERPSWQHLGVLLAKAPVTSGSLGSWLMWPSMTLLGDPTDLASEAGTIGGALKLTGFHVFNVGMLYLFSAWALRERPSAGKSPGRYRSFVAVATRSS